MNILFATSELSPYAKTGGLGEVLAALPAALRARGHSVSVILPLYRSVVDSLRDLRETGVKITVPMGVSTMEAVIWSAKSDLGVPLFLVQRDEFYDRSQIYGTATGDYTDNAGRFIFFSKVAVEVARYLKPLPQILHSNDWQTALIPALVRAATLPYRTVLTIHNLAFQGSFWAFDFDLTNLPGEYFTPQGIEFYGRMNLLKGGIVLAHQVTTVSPRYAEEIQGTEFGCRLEGVLREGRHKLTGILNAVDYTLWNPESDHYLPAPYTDEALEGKKACKQALLASFGLPPGDAPVFGIVSRLTNQKGFDLLSSYLREFLEHDIRLVILGNGDPYYEKFFAEMARQYPQKLGLRVAFDQGLAHQIQAGSDFFLMPSRFEPCGLSQLYALRYGTPPIVHDIGGLADTVEQLQDDKGTGFTFAPYEVHALRRAVVSALQVYKDPPALLALRKRGMARRFSWDQAAAEYERVYKDALK